MPSSKLFYCVEIAKHVGIFFRIFKPDMILFWYLNFFYIDFYFLYFLNIELNFFIYIKT